jgi:hypothetical protein
VTAKAGDLPRKYDTAASLNLVFHINVPVGI